MTGHNQKIGGGGFHHIAMQVKDFDASLQFYTEGLGFTPTVAWGEGSQRAVMLDTGDGNYFELFAGGGRGEAQDWPIAGPVEGLFEFGVEHLDVLGGLGR